eukprot:TRINITY_DN1742_c0_g1_i1.p1 TRINITY_DN1742_c0_g1~~TRINITY_DN1742_c0_g1_i1.p1  ORF type:complete len:565 (-),score=142.72 TRINITY_DN1742_c0_g1_i1:68-1762(-)
MEALDAIVDTFQSGRTSEAVAELVGLVDQLKQASSPDLNPAHYDLLGQFRNYLGDQEGAVLAYLEGVELFRQRAREAPRDDDAAAGDEHVALPPTTNRFPAAYISLNLKIAQMSHRQGKEGSGVVYKKKSVCYGPKKTASDEEEEAWKKERFERAVKAYRAAIDALGDDEEDAEYREEFQTQLASCYFDMKDFDSAIKLYEDAFQSDNNARWLFKAAECLWGQKQYEAAVERLERVIELRNNFAPAYDLLSKYYKDHKNDPEKAAQLGAKHRFFSWVPSFARHIEFNDENQEIVRELQSERALQCVETTLANDPSTRSNEFLAAICWHHYHGPPETKSFKLLEERAHNDEYISGLLIELLSNHQSVCTVKGAASALAGIKHPRAFEFLQRLLPQDVQMFPMHIPLSIGKLGDPRGIPLLLKVIKSASRHIEDDDSDDDLGSIGQERLFTESCLALATFKDNEEVVKALQEGLNVEKIRDACLAALFQITKDEEQYLQPLIDKLDQGKYVDVYARSQIIENDPSGKFADALSRKDAADKERERLKQIADEIGVENWEPTDEQLQE